MDRILITGASRGLGKVCVEAFQKDWKVYPFTRKDFDYLKCSAWNSVVPEVDAVIHCAGGGLGMRGPLLTAQAMYDLFMVNLGGALEINRMVLPRMMAEGKGFIVHVLSIAAGEAVGSVGYNTVKTALSGYVRSVGREVAPYGVVVTGISPGAFQAPGNAMERLMQSTPGAYYDFLNTRLPRKKMGLAEELIPILRLLVSKEASMMGGSVIAVDAGEARYYS